MTTPTAEEVAAIPLLASLSREELQTATQWFTVRSYPKNAIVATEGDRLDLFNVILSGNVQAFWRDEAGHQLKLGSADGQAPTHSSRCRSMQPRIPRQAS